MIVLVRELLSSSVLDGETEGVGVAGGVTVMVLVRVGGKVNDGEGVGVTLSDSDALGSSERESDQESVGERLDDALNETDCESVGTVDKVADTVTVKEEERLQLPDNVADPWVGEGLGVKEGFVRVLDPLEAEAVGVGPDSDAVEDGVFGGD